MLLLFSIATIAAVLLGAALSISLHKRFANGNLSIIGHQGYVQTALTPDGAVIIRGEIWRARSVDGRAIACSRAVRVVGIQDLCFLVENL